MHNAMALAALCGGCKTKIDTLTVLNQRYGANEGRKMANWLKWARRAKAVLATILLTLYLSPASAGAPKIGQPAPDAILYLVKGKPVRLSDLRGQVVVINFWATWCVPCRKELPTLDAYYRLQSQHGLQVYAATTEDSVPEIYLHKLFGALAITPVRHIKGPYDPLEGVPTNYVIDRAGVLRYAKAGAFDLDALNELLVPLLREAPPVATPASHPILDGGEAGNHATRS